METEQYISEMMKLNVKARIWHWSTGVAQHHTTYEQFLTQNETLTDSFVESCLGNDVALSFNKIGVSKAIEDKYSLDQSTSEIKKYRSDVSELKKILDKNNMTGAEELVTILDDVTELCSKTLYLLKLK